MLQKIYDWFKGHHLGWVAVVFALVVTFLTGRKLGSVNAVNRGVAGDVPAELDRAKRSVEGAAEHAEHSTESIAAVLRKLGSSEAAGNRSLDGISESRDISQRIQELEYSGHIYSTGPILGNHHSVLWESPSSVRQ